MPARSRTRADNRMHRVMAERSRNRGAQLVEPASARATPAAAAATSG